MAHIYIALVDTPGLFAWMIRRTLKQRYIHVALGMDPLFEEAYSVGRRWPSVPVLAGFEREDKRKILRAFPTAGYYIYRMECTEAQKEQIRAHLYRDFKRKYSIHYAVLGLPFLLAGRPFYQKNHYTCSSYVARILAESGIIVSKKHFSLVTPKDFYEYEDRQMIFEGDLREIVSTMDRNLQPRVEAVYE